MRSTAVSRLRSSLLPLLAFVAERLRHGTAACKWLALTVPMAAVVGTFVAGFLWALDVVTDARLSHPWLLFGLPLAGAAIGATYAWVGRSAEGGNNLIVDQIHEPGGGVPLRMAPLIVAATVVTHLFGGSAGREGTAVQLGGSIASAFGKHLRLSPPTIRILLTAGIAAGFGAVFGTPVAGAVFALEVLAVGQVQYAALVPCILAAVVGDWTCHAWGIRHVAYHVAFSGVPEASGTPFHIDPVLTVKVALVGVASGLAGLVFSEASHRIGALSKKLCPTPWQRPALGGLLVIGLVYGVGTRAYLGLGVTAPDPNDPSIVSFFGSHVFDWAWAWKILFTVVTLGTGFKGGEVTPLFFIGAGLGNALSGVLGGPTDLFAALGFVAIFAGASNTPLACTIMGIELFGATNTVYIAVACFVAYLCSGHSGIYLAQRLAVPKTSGGAIPPDIALRHVREIGSRSVDGFDLPFPRGGGALFSDPNPEEDQTVMPHAHHVSAKEIGMLRIYLKPKERFRDEAAGRIRAALSGRPLYQELVQRAKQAGLMNATAHHTHYGFSNHGEVAAREVESMNTDLTMCVELIGPKAKLEAFCRQHGGLLAEKVIVYKHLEHWHVGKTPSGQTKLSEKDVPDAAALNQAG